MTRIVNRFLAVLLAALLGLPLAGCDAPPAEQKAAAKPKPAATAPKSDLIDINRASAEELMALKGIGEARAKAIIKNRPYARKDELVHQKIVPQSVYEDIKDEIVQRKLVPQTVYDDIKHLIIARQK